MHLLTIDPGIGSTGWAYWPSTEVKGFKPKPVSTGLVRTRLAESWHKNAHHQAFELVHVIPAKQNLKVFCEMPIFFSTAGGHAAAETNSLQKLCYQVGTFAEAIRELHISNDFVPIPVRDWKGQLPKAEVCRRIQKILGAEACENYKADVWDAIGIGLFVMGVFK